MWYLLALLAVASVTAHPFKTIASWKTIGWNFPNDSFRESYLTSGHNISEEALPLAMNVWEDKLFVVVPRWAKGAPASLNYISLSEATAAENSSPLLNPYPDWETNDIRSPDAIVNIMKVRIDACDRLWAIDGGIDDGVGEFNQIPRIRLIAIDLKTNKIILKYTFKNKDLEPRSFFTDTVIDVDPKNCDDAYVYNADAGAYGLVVYSLAKNYSWRINHNYFHMDPLNGGYNVNGLKFQWSAGLYGMALSPPKEDGSKTLYFHSMSGIHSFSVSTSLLNNPIALADPNWWKELHIEGNRGPMTQATSSIFDPETGIIYFTQVNKNAVACWDTHEKLNPDTFRIVAQDDTEMIYPNDVAIDPKTRKFYCLSNNVPVQDFSHYDFEKTNFFIHSASLDDLTAACHAKTEPKAASPSSPK